MLLSEFPISFNKKNAYTRTNPINRGRYRLIIIFEHEYKKNTKCKSKFNKLINQIQKLARCLFLNQVQIYLLC